MENEFDPATHFVNRAIDWLFSARVKQCIKFTLLASYATLLYCGWWYIVFNPDVEWWLRGLGVYVLLTTTINFVYDMVQVWRKRT